ncbi:hypothetical protein [Thiomonas sp. 13-64-67]|uniref:hypothetical protein n=1 Tax=Thiomonas sp. 13-64-67 TaxID=1970447 RepID=UPI00257BDF01|nr:hypothetical protein [Thiomonas sp. 13-64-67]
MVRSAPGNEVQDELARHQPGQPRLAEQGAELLQHRRIAAVQGGQRGRAGGQLQRR